MNPTYDIADILGFQPVYSWKPSLPDPRDKIYTQGAVISSLPNIFSLRPKMPEVYNQLQLGSCTANAIASMLQLKLILEGKATNSLGDCPSRLMLYYLERVREGTVNSDAGAFGRDGFASLRKTGVCREELWPYDINLYAEKPSTTAYENAKWGKILEYDHPITEAAQMLSISNNKPIAFGFNVPRCFESEECMTTGVMPEPTENEEYIGGHEVVRIGWKPGYWECRNSWGSGVMDNGYFWMSKEFGNSGFCSDYRAITA